MRKISLSYLVIGYLVGMWLSDIIFADLALTQWTNIMTYVWIAFWPYFLLVHAIVYGIIIFAVLYAVYWIKGEYF